MADLIQAVRGMNDILPEQTALWQYVERQLSSCLAGYGYQEIRLPIIESTALFKRSIGEITDIVQKEMYTFQDLNGDSITLRPEGTAGCVRACLENGLLHNQQQRLWYVGPMFRHERPQKGRYRQFTQLGVEILGIPGIAAELEMLLLCARFWSVLGIQQSLTLQINTLGELEERNHYKEVLVAYLKQHWDSLDADSRQRLDTNPLRILDSKAPEMQGLIADAPKLMDVLGEASLKSYEELCQGLTLLGIAYEHNPKLVRGLDYYGHMVFEWVTDKLGSQATVCAGGRYDALLQQLGANPTPGLGFAMGLERLLLLMEALGLGRPATKPLSVFIMSTTPEATIRALAVAESIRNQYPQAEVIFNAAGGSFKSQFKKADKSNAQLALILGEDEMQANTIAIKNLREKSEQVSIEQGKLIQFLQDYQVGK